MCMCPGLSCKMSQLKFLKLRIWTLDWGKVQRRISEQFPFPHRLRSGKDESEQLCLALCYSRAIALCAQGGSQSYLSSSRLQVYVGPARAFLSHAGLCLYCLLFFSCVLCTLVFIKFYSIGTGISLCFVVFFFFTMLLLLLKIPFVERIYSKLNFKPSYVGWTISYLC